MIVPRGEQVDLALDRARAADARAVVAARRAERAEKLVDSGPPGQRDLHRQVAERHRRSELGHRTTARIQRSLAGQLAASASVGQILARTLADVFQAPDAAIVLLGSDGSTADSQGTEGLADAAQDLEFIHAEGPMRSASASNRTIEVAGADVVEAWPCYGPEVAALGVSSVRAAPLKLGPRTIGAVGFFNPPSGMNHDASLGVLAEEFARLVVRSTGEVAPADPAQPDGMSVIHQASGYIAAKSSCDVTVALSLIRARAFVEGQPAAAVARRVLAGELHLAP